MLTWVQFIFREKRVKNEKRHLINITEYWETEKMFTTSILANVVYIKLKYNKFIGKKNLLFLSIRCLYLINET